MFNLETQYKYKGMKAFYLSRLTLKCVIVSRFIVENISLLNKVLLNV